MVRGHSEGEVCAVGFGISDRWHCRDRRLRKVYVKHGVMCGTCTLTRRRISSVRKPLLRVVGQDVDLDAGDHDGLVGLRLQYEGKRNWCTGTETRCVRRQ